MVNVENGKLVTCDPALKQFLLNLDEKREFGGRRFILKGKYRGWFIKIYKVFVILNLFFLLYFSIQTLQVSIDNL